MSGRVALCMITSMWSGLGVPPFPRCMSTYDAVTMVLINREWGSYQKYPHLDALFESLAWPAMRADSTRNAGASINLNLPSSYNIFDRKFRLAKVVKTAFVRSHQPKPASWLCCRLFSSRYLWWLQLFGPLSKLKLTPTCHPKYRSTRHPRVPCRWCPAPWRKELHRIATTSLLHLASSTFAEYRWLQF